MIEIAQIVAGWPLAASMAATVVVQGLRNGRRRAVLNEALHELRRPLQAVALASGRAGSGIEDPIDLAAAALDRLDREINGGSLPAGSALLDAGRLIESSVNRWQARVKMGDGSLELRWNAGPTLVRGERCALTQVIDNLIVNAIEHGGPSIVVSARRRERWLRIAVVDSGCSARPRPRRGAPAAVIARLAGKSRRGHGLVIVRRVAAMHDGRFALQHSARGSTAVLELPIADDVAEVPA